MKQYKFLENRQGFTLIEMVFVIGAEIAVVALGVGVLFLVTEARIKEQQNDRARLVASRMAVQFRKDVRAATETDYEFDVLSLTQPDGKEVRYFLDMNSYPEKSSLHRERYENGRCIDRDTFELPDHSSAWFETGEGKHAGFIALNIWTIPTDRYGVHLVLLPEKERLNSFTREYSEDDGAIRIDSRYAANWRTIISKYTDMKTDETE